MPIVPRVLVTGMSGTGKTTLLYELRQRGHLTVDTDYDEWQLPDGTWDQPRMAQLLDMHPDVVVSGTVSNQVNFYSRFGTWSSCALRWTYYSSGLLADRTTRMARQPNNGTSSDSISRRLSQPCDAARASNSMAAFR